MKKLLIITLLTGFSTFAQDSVSIAKKQVPELYKIVLQERVLKTALNDCESDKTTLNSLIQLANDSIQRYADSVKVEKKRNEALTIRYVKESLKNQELEDKVETPWQTVKKWTIRGLIFFLGFKIGMSL